MARYHYSHATKTLQIDYTAPPWLVPAGQFALGKSAIRCLHYNGEWLGSAVDLVTEYRPGRCRRTGLANGWMRRPGFRKPERGIMGSGLPFLFVEPGACPDLCAPAERAIAHGNHLGGSMAHKDMAGKIYALAAVLEPTIDNTTDKDSTFPAACTTQAVAAATTTAILICVATAAVSATDSR